MSEGQRGFEARQTPKIPVATGCAKLPTGGEGRGEGKGRRGARRTPPTTTAPPKRTAVPQPRPRTPVPPPVGAVRERPKRREGSEAHLRRNKDSPNQNHPLPHTPDHQLKTSINHQQNPLSRSAGEGRCEGPGRRARRTPSPRIPKQPPPNPKNPPPIPRIPIQTEQQKSSKSFQIMKIMVQKQRIPPNPTLGPRRFENLSKSSPNHLTTRISVLHL